MGLEDVFDSPLLVAPLQKMREVFVLQPVLRKKLSRIFKIHLFSQNRPPEDDMLNRQKMAKIEKSGFFFGKAVFRTPPEVVSGFFFFRGGGSAGIISRHVEGRWF
jgi:hypothetical protein